MYFQSLALPAKTRHRMKLSNSWLKKSVSRLALFLRETLTTKLSRGNKRWTPHIIQSQSSCLILLRDTQITSVVLPSRKTSHLFRIGRIRFRVKDHFATRACCLKEMKRSLAFKVKRTRIMSLRSPCFHLKPSVSGR